MVEKEEAIFSSILTYKMIIYPSGKLDRTLKAWS